MCKSCVSVGTWLNRLDDLYGPGMDGVLYLLVKSRKASGTTQVCRSDSSSIPIGQAHLTAR